jgi:hypothetical protein
LNTSKQGNGNPHDDNEMKWVFFRSMPETWKDAFTNDGNNDISSSSIDALNTFMKQQEARARAKAAANKAKQLIDRKRDRDDDSESSGNSSNWKNPKKHRRKKKGYGQDAEGKSNGKDANGRCHKCRHNHLWKDCFCNPNNPNNKLQDSAKKNNGNKTNGKDNGKDAGHSHAIDEMPEVRTGFMLETKPKATKAAMTPRPFDPAFACLKGTDSYVTWCLLRQTQAGKVAELWRESERRRCQQD